MERLLTNGVWMAGASCCALGGMYLTASSTGVGAVVQDADIWAAYTARWEGSAKVQVVLEFLRQYFSERYELPG